MLCFILIKMQSIYIKLLWKKTLWDWPYSWVQLLENHPYLNNSVLLITDYRSLIAYKKTSDQLKLCWTYFLTQFISFASDFWSFKYSSSTLWIKNLIFVVPCIMLNSEINPTRCNNCVYWWWVELSPETCRVKPLRRINAIVASCWIYFAIKNLLFENGGTKFLRNV